MDGKIKANDGPRLPIVWSMIVRRALNYLTMLVFPMSWEKHSSAVAEWLKTCKKAGKQFDTLSGQRNRTHGGAFS
jgi:hypothetical protein